VLEQPSGGLRFANPPYALLQGFQRNGIDAVANLDNNITDANDVRIVVGAHP
jgi:hypothetical protein